MRDVIVFESGDKGVDFRVMLDGDTVWLSQAQMVELFGRDQSVIARHIRNAIDDGEVLVESNMQKMQIANSDKPVVFYDLDVIMNIRSIIEP